MQKFEEYCSDIQYAVSIKEDTTYLCLHFTRNHEEQRHIRRIQKTSIRRVDITAKTRRPQAKSNRKNDRVPSASKSSWIKNKDVEVEKHHRNLLLSKNKKHISFECNNIKLAIRNDKSEVVCVMCKQWFITTNHDVRVLYYVNGMNSCNDNQSTNVSNNANHKKHMPKVKKPKKSGSKERLASPRLSKPRTYVRWSPTGRILDHYGKIIESSDFECKSDTSVYDDANASNPHEPTIKRFPNSTSFLGRFRICCSEGTLVLSEILKELTLLKGNRSTNLVTPSISMKLASTAIPNLPHGSSNFYQVMVMASTIIPPQF
ncbi:hypothetical protein Tco_0694875 [Tanacetum coccineum]